MKIEHQQRLELVGRMATGIAHDLNNQMMVILNHLDFALEQIPAHYAVRTNLADVQRAAGRCTEMLGSLLSFGRPSRRELLPVELEPVISETGRLLRRVLPANIELLVEVEPKLNVVIVDSTQIQQILINLAMNARDAMPKGGKLIISAENHEDRIWLKVADNGIGINARDHQQIYEPYYTTKSKSGGTGLGLVMVASLVKQNGGTIRVESQPGIGTRFRIEFPSHKIV
jgi:two-component system, cell cycle sensor histidine kinase and response regulator CckA